jgi:uncharacterized membrane protein YraQ (UPF0718 family)
VAADGVATGLGPGPSRRGALVGVAVVAGLLIAGLLWAKWVPYVQRFDVVRATDAYPGSSLLDAAGAAGDGPSLRAGWDFTTTYMRAIWPALLVAIVVAAAIQALLPRRWLVGVLTGRLGSVRGGLAALPTMMCTCCCAPLTVTLRRNGVGLRPTLAYWLGNPTLNPAVIAFLAILLPWQWVVTRVGVGMLLVFVVTTWVARAADRDAERESPPDHLRSGRAELAPEPSDHPRGATAELLPHPAQLPPDDLRGAPVRFVRALARLCVTLVPEYVVVVFAVGALHGWLFPFDGDVGAWAVLGAAVLGTLVVLPTAGEIPILHGLAAAGAGPGLLGTLLIALPAVSLPSLVMVARALTVRVTVLTAAAVAATSLVGGCVLWALS